MRVESAQFAMIRKRIQPRTKKRARAVNKIRRRAKPVESTRERILSAAATLFAEHGFEGSSMPAIARSSGITAGAIYKHFKSKGELLLEVVKRSFESTPLFIQNATTGAATELPRLASVYTEPELKLVRQLSIEVHAAASRDSGVRRVLAVSDQAAIRHIGDAISMAQRDGKLDPKLNPDFAARMFCIFIMGLLHMDTLLPGLIGNKEWRAFVHERISGLIGAR